MNYTKEQQNILDNCEQNLFISAAPGSGKSTILAKICENLVNTSNDSKVLLLTFTNSAAKSIIDKCANIDKNRIVGGTFHSIAYRSLKQAGVTATICDENKKRLIIKTIFNCRKDKKKFEEIYDQICTSKSTYPYIQNNCTTKYNEELDKYSLLDFDDIITRFIEMRGANEINCSTNFKAVLMDEMQDTSSSQFEMLNKLSQSSELVIGVGDIDQCIYEWRAARPENVNTFIDKYSCTVFNMGTNFRSDSQIVRCSTNLIKNNKKRLDKETRSYTHTKGTIKTYFCNHPFDELDYVTAKCIQNDRHSIAILYRNRTFKYQLEHRLRKAGLAYKVNDSFDITDRSAVRVVVTCLKIAANSYDYFDIEQATKALKGIGSKTLSLLKEETERSDFKTTISRWTNDDKLKKRLKSVFNLQKSFKDLSMQSLDNLTRKVEDEFISSFDYQGQMRELLCDITKGYVVKKDSIQELADELGLNSTEEQETDDPNATIELSTIHGFKGLEDDVVIMPHCQSFLDPVANREIDIEAERRLFYVGVTRAKHKLYLCYSGQNTPRFITEMKI